MFAVQPEHALILYLFIIAVTQIFLCYQISRHPARLRLYLLSIAAYGIVAVLTSYRLSGGIFVMLGLLAYATFGGGITLFSVLAYLAWHHRRKTAYAFVATAIAIALVTIDAFLLEPHDLQVRHETITSKKIDRQIKIAVVTDIQTDDVGPYELHALQTVMDESPDLILFPGDYIQEHVADKRGLQYKLLHDVFKRTDLHARLGVIAVPGNTEYDDWPSIFEGVPNATLCVTPKTLDLGELVVTGVPMLESFTGSYLPPHFSKFHVMVGHGPDYVLKNPDADLFIAGHTHGGQVQLPFIGPIFTFSHVPRKWAAGCCVRFPDSRALVISRGIGMERHFAPRLRFLCKPEIVFVTVVPEKG